MHWHTILDSIQTIATTLLPQNLHKVFIVCHLVSYPDLTTGDGGLGTRLTFMSRYLYKVGLPTHIDRQQE